MSKRIRGITIEIAGDTQKLTKALEDVNKKSRDIQSELKQVDQLLKLDPKNTELLAQKKKLLAEAVENSREKLNRLQEAQKQVEEQFRRGEIGEEQYRAFQRELVKTEQELRNFERQLTEATSTAKKWSDQLHKAGDSLKNIGQRMGDVGKNLSTKLTAPIAAAGGAVLALGVKAGQTADRLLDLSDITGLTTDSIQEWQYVAKLAGVETEAMTRAVEGFVRKIPQLEAEGGKATEQLQKLGVSFEELKKMTPDQQIDVLISRLAAMDDSLERNAIGATLFGGAWKDLAPILGMGAEGIEKAKEEARELGLVLDREALQGANQFRQEMDRMKAVLEGAAVQIGAQLAPVLSEKLIPLIEQKVVPAIKSFGEWIGNIITWFTELDPKIQSAILIIAGLAAAIGPLLVVFGMMASGIGTIISVFGSLIAVIPTLGAVFTALTGPIGLVIAAIAAAVAIGWYLYKNWNEIKNKITSLWDSISARVRSVLEGMRSFFGSIWSAIRGTVESAVSAIYNNTVGRFYDLVSSARSILSGIVEAIAAPFRRAWEQVNDITDNIRSALNKINPFARFSPSLVEQVRDGVARIQREYAKLQSIALPGPILQTVAHQSTLTPVKPAAVSTISFERIFDGAVINVRSDNDIKQLAREIYGLFQSRSRSAGVIG